MASTGPTATSTTTLEGTVTWQKEASPDPAGLPVRAGMVRYRISSGQMHIAYRATRNFPAAGVSCTDQGAADLALGPNDMADDPELRSYLDLGEDGQYVGALRRDDLTITISYACTNGSVGSFSGNPRVSQLSIRGTLTTGRRIQGEMVPDTSVGQTTTGSWDFGPR